MMSLKTDNKRKANLCGVAYIRAINTSDHFKSLSEEAKNIFLDANSKRFVTEQLLKKDAKREQSPDLSNLNPPMQDFMRRALLNLGKREFLECKIEFNLKDGQTLIHDIVTEITIKDGIITKIVIPNLKYAYEDT